jgi:hypothetical protein
MRVVAAADAVSTPGVSEIDVLCCSPLRKPARALDMATVRPPLGPLPRVIELQGAGVAEGDYSAALAAWLSLPQTSRPVVRWYWPTQSAIDDPMDFDPTGIERAIAVGYDRGRSDPVKTWPPAP